MRFWCPFRFVRDTQDRPPRFKIFVRSGFNGYELASVRQIPCLANEITAGFGSTTALSLAIKEQYCITPSKMRARRRVDLLKFA